MVVLKFTNRLRGALQTLVLRIRKPRLHALLNDDSFEWEE